MSGRPFYSLFLWSVQAVAWQVIDRKNSSERPVLVYKIIRQSHSRSVGVVGYHVRLTRERSPVRTRHRPAFTGFGLFAGNQHMKLVWRAACQSTIVMMTGEL